MDRSTSSEGEKKRGGEAGNYPSLNRTLSSQSTAGVVRVERRKQNEELSIILDRGLCIFSGPGLGPEPNLLGRRLFVEDEVGVARAGAGL